MGSRRRQVSRGEYVHSTLGKGALGDALTACVNLCQREVKQRVEFTHTQDWIRQGVFAPDTLKLAADARRIMNGAPEAWTDYPIGNEVNLRLWWNNTDMIDIKPECMLPNVSGQSCWELYEHSPLQHLVPMMKARDQIQKIATKWQRARAVIGKMDTCVTLGGFRHYLPAIRQLCDSDVPAELPSRFNEPLQIGPWIPLIREAQETIATSALLPDTAPARRTDVVQFHVNHRDEKPTSDLDVIVQHEAWHFTV